MPGFLVASQRDDAVDVLHVADDAVSILGSVPVTDAIFLIAHPQRPVVHVASSSDGGTITTLDLATGKTRSVTGVGEEPCYLHLVDEEHLVCANYGSGSVSAIHLADSKVDAVTSTLELPNTPRLGANKERQETSHPHSVRSWGQDLLVTDLGTDSIHRVELHDGELTLAGEFSDLPAGAGPRHVEPGDDGGLWVTRELDNGVSLVTNDGLSTVSATMNGIVNHVGDITRHEPSGTVAVANRDVNTVAVFRHAALGIERVAEISCGGRWPTQLATDGEVLAVANRDSDSIALFAGVQFWKANPVLVDVKRPISVQRAPGWVTPRG